MSRHPGLPPEASGSNEFYSDANLMKRAQPASYADFGLLPGETQSDALASSPALQMYQRHGGQLAPIPLADIEVDDGSRSADYAPTMLDHTPSTPSPAVGGVDESSLDRLADLLLDRMQKKLLGGQ